MVMGLINYLVSVCKIRVRAVLAGARTVGRDVVCGSAWENTAYILGLEGGR